ncbi:dihydrodipicolinate synthase [Erysipelotrichaceae bacterium]|nr:dihydrodipicolinate synthase [Erysipelotrichaceae bacterium]
MKIFSGSATAIVTPFTADGKAVDFEALTRFIEFQITEGTQALIINGTTAEAATMSLEEDTRVLEHAIQITAGRIPIIAGTGSNNTVHAVTETKIAQDLGADAVLIVTPYYNKTTQAGLIAHYEAIMAETDIPIILYNVPGRTGMSIEIDTVIKLSSYPQIIGIKDATGDMSYTMELFARQIADFAIYTGNDDLYIPFLSMGGDGIISVISNIYPKVMQTIFEVTTKGDFAQAAMIANRLHPVLQALYAEVNPVGAKAALALMGVQNGILRLPLIPMSAEKNAKLAAAITAYDKIR